MIKFNSDYSEGCHPKILEQLTTTNLIQTVGYGEDEYCQQAKDLIKKVINQPKSDVHFLVGGTQTNLIVISSALRPYEGVISPTSGHINVHETGAIEATGHKIITVEHQDGKLSPSQIEKIMITHKNDPAYEHTVKPKMVYISYSTEYGTIYSKQELQQIYQTCQKYQLYLFIDGARLGYGLMSSQSDLSIEDIAKYCDVFYIGGTKIGALFGEALIINNDYLKTDFRYNIKQKGAMLAKGRLLGIQFLTLFTDNLYFDISKHAIDMANILKDGIKKLEYQFYIESSTNQQFIILTNKQVQQLQKTIGFSIIETLNDNSTIVRFCTSWATKKEDIDYLLQQLSNIKHI
ncbi:MAG: low specificity L-threonine aldolase [Erysipelotrichaceae bacterium]